MSCAGRLVRRMLATSLAQGASVLIAVAVLYAWALSVGWLEPQARAIAFTSVVLANVGLILVSRSRHEMLLTTIRRPNPALGWIVGAAILGLALVLCIKPLREMFRFGPLTGYQVLLSVAAAAAGLGWLEIYKWLRLRPARARGPFK